MIEQSHPDINNLVVDLMTYQAFVAGLTHIHDMMLGEGLTFQESLLRILTETFESEFSFVAIQNADGGGLRRFASYPDPLPAEMPDQVASPLLLAAIKHERYDMVKDTSETGRQMAPGIRCALVVPYRNRGAQCVLCVCNRDPEAYARPDLGVPYVSHEIKMCQALLELRPI